MINTPEIVRTVADLHATIADWRQMRLSGELATNGGGNPLPMTLGDYEMLYRNAIEGRLI